jgi:hypothetical protein
MLPKFKIWHETHDQNRSILVWIADRIRLVGGWVHGNDFRHPADVVSHVAARCNKRQSQQANGK